ncbi:MFS transporter [Silvimonas iriomotensis]|nr:MFS transporter [Silvimonas iriomotensis]
MNQPQTTTPQQADHAGISSGLITLLAVSCGLIVANIYYAQPLIGPISAALGLPVSAAGLIVTMTQIGYGAGLILVVPLGDLFENQRLTLVMVGLAAVSLLAAAFAPAPLPFLTAALFIGIGSVAVQILVPYAAHLAPEASRGRVVGNVMSGLMLGVMLARPVSSFITALSSWHVVFVLSALAMVMLGLVLRSKLPQRQPAHALSYAELLSSMAHLALNTPILRRRALYQACMFGTFSVFWTTSPLLLAGPYQLTQRGIALFALAGVAGAIAAPIAGRVADQGWSRPATAIAMILAAVAWLLTHLAPQGSALALGLLVVAAIMIDFGVQANVVLGQRAIFALGAHARSRLNGLYMATFFAAGAITSALGGWAYAHGGWIWASALGLALPVVALVYFATEKGGE